MNKAEVKDLDVGDIIFHVKRASPYEVESKGQVKMFGEWSECLTYRCMVHEGIYTRLITNFEGFVLHTKGGDYDTP